MKLKYLASLLNKNSILGAFTIRRDVLICKNSGKVRMCLYVGKTIRKDEMTSGAPLKLRTVRKLETNKKFAKELDEKVINIELVANVFCV